MSMNGSKEGKKTVLKFFDALKEKDVGGMLDLFDDNCIVREPFSTEVSLNGKADVKSFLSTMCYACEGVDCSVLFEAAANNDFESLAKCEFRLGDSVTGHFRFKFKPFSDEIEKARSLKIQELDIKF